MKTIITHLNPDLDAITSIWLLKRFLPGWEKAKIFFVPAGSTFNNLPADSQAEVLHVDTGGGQLDHHQLSGMTSAAALTWEYILLSRKSEPISRLDQEAGERIVAVVTLIDNARDLSWPETTDDRFEFYLQSLIYGIKRIIADDGKLIDQGLILLDGLSRSFKDKIKAEEKIEKDGIKFNTGWGQAIAVETGNEKILWEAEVKGYALVVKYDPQFPQRVKIYSRYDSQVNLTAAYKELQKIDPAASWYLHQSKKLLMISSDPAAQGTRLTLEEIIKILKNLSLTKVPKRALVILD